MMIQYYAMPGLKYRHQTISRNERAASAVDEICQYFHTTYAAIRKRDRRRHVVEVRIVVMHFLRRNLNLTLKSIGEMFRMDHTSVIHGIKRCTDLMATDPVFLRQVQEVDNIVY